MGYRRSGQDGGNSDTGEAGNEKLVTGRKAFSVSTAEGKAQTHTALTKVLRHPGSRLQTKTKYKSTAESQKRESDRSSQKIKKCLE